MAEASAHAGVEGCTYSITHPRAGVPISVNPSKGKAGLADFLLALHKTRNHG